jgi:DNA-directed RNA polymerase I, II, and III subunit RPABC2
MSDTESYYSNSSDSDEDDNEQMVIKPVIKKPIVINTAKNFGEYVEDGSDSDEFGPDDADVDADDDADVDVDADADADKEEEEEEEEELIGGVKKYEDEEADEEEEDIEEPDDDSDIEIDEDGQVIEKIKTAGAGKTNKATQLIINDDDYDDDDDDYEENYLQKFDAEINKNYITEFHPECLNHNSDEVSKLSKVIRDENNIIIDPLHRTIPYLTKYEKARILGQRAKQIETGAKPFVKVPENIIDGYLIAEFELREKKIPFIIKRPIPGGAFEYWNVEDLENIIF